MSFGFGIGDILAVSELASHLYRRCYFLAPGASQEFQLLLQEIGTLSQSIVILQQEARNPDSVLLRSWEEGDRMNSEMIAGVKVTLSDIGKMAARYEKLKDMSRSERISSMLRGSIDFSELGSLRNQVSSGL